jgi:uncharacterized protein (DUF433 family)
MTPELMANLSATAYVVGVSERDANRIFDESLLPCEAIKPRRTLTPLGCVMASFYFHEAENLTADFRKRVLTVLSRRRESRQDESVFNPQSASDWDIEVGSFLVHFGGHAEETSRRMASLAKSESLVECDPSIFDGEPVFKGTRVPVRTIAAWVAEGADRERVREAYPHLTDDMFAAAPIWAKTHPVRGRPRKFDAVNSSWRVKSVSTRKLGRE